jgi:3-deoxy-D-manno-octulosonic-acid transferase
MTRYDLAYLALSPIAVPIILYRRIAYGKYRQSLPGMFGKHWSGRDSDKWSQGSVWVHAVSVGECVAAKALIPKLKAHFSDYPFVLTTVTETGQETAKTLFSNHVDEITYYPADFSWVVGCFLAHYRPRLFVIMETELWPNAIVAASQHGCQVVLANGRISEKSFASYRRLRRFFKRPLEQIRAFCMQTSGDAERIIAIGAPRERVFVTGNCKFDVNYAHPSPERLKELKTLLRIDPARPVIVAGSTHPGEEEILLAGLRKLKESGHPVQLILVPRHPERFAAVWRDLGLSGFSALRLSTGELVTADQSATQTGPPDVILVDKMGMLAELYCLASIAVVAGSFVPGIGGHNLLEAAVHGVPVVYGPYMDKQPELTRILSPANGGVVVDAEHLAEALMSLLRDPEKRRKLGEQAKAAALSQQGAAERTMAIIKDVCSQAAIVRVPSAEA